MAKSIMHKILTDVENSQTTFNKIKKPSKKGYQFGCLIVISIVVGSMLLIYTSVPSTEKNVDHQIYDNYQENNSPKVASSEGFIWYETWGNSSIEEGYSVWGDGNYLYTTGWASYDLLVIKWHLNGTQIWNKTWGGEYWEFGESIWGDGTYLYITGRIQNYNTGEMNLCISKWDTNGNRIWNKTWGGSSVDMGLSICGNGTYLYTTGRTSSFGTGGGDLCLIQWDTDGNQIWNKTWGSTLYEVGYSIKCDGDYLYITGQTNGFGAGGGDLCILKWDTNGNRIWNKTWGGINTEAGNSIWIDSTYLYTSGKTNSFGEGSTDYFIIKWDTNGNRIWNKTWGGFNDETCNSIWGDGSYLYITGQTQSFGAVELGIIKWDTNGNQIWNQSWDGPSSEEGYSIWGDANNLYITGSTNSYGGGGSDLCLIKWDQVPTPNLDPISGPNTNGNVELNWNDIEEADDYSIYRHNKFIDEINGTLTMYGHSTSEYTDIDVSEGTWYYVVKANSLTANSSISNCKSVVVDLPGPTAPILKIIDSPNTNGSIYLDWEDVPNADNYTVYRHKKYINEINGSISIVTNTQISSEYTDTGRPEGNFYYAIVALNNTGNSSLSNCKKVVVDLPSPAAPDLESVASPNTNGIIQLNWNDVPNANNYSVYRYDSYINEINGTLNENGTFNILTNSQISSQYTDVGRPEGIYYYVIVAINATGNSSLSNCKSVVVDLPNPTTPILESIGSPNTNGVLQLNWNDVPNTDNYTIYRHNRYINEINGSLKVLTNSQISSQYTDVGLSEGIYYYVIVAINSTGNSSHSNCKSVVVDLPSPAAPMLQNITTPNTNGIIMLVWNSVSNADNYTIYRHISLITEINESLSIIVKNYRSLNYMDPGRPNGMWYYAIVALNATGNSSLSNCVSVFINIPGTNVNTTNNGTTGNDNTNNQTIIIAVIAGVGGASVLVALTIIRKKIKTDQIKGDQPTVGDLGAFTAALDSEFADWGEKEQAKDGKIE
jgi:fibronectin type 3 domain-containing protein